MHVYLSNVIIFHTQFSSMLLAKAERMLWASDLERTTWRSLVVTEENLGVNWCGLSYVFLKLINSWIAHIDLNHCTNKPYTAALQRAGCRYSCRCLCWYLSHPLCVSSLRDSPKAMEQRTLEGSGGCRRWLWWAKWHHELGADEPKMVCLAEAKKHPGRSSLSLAFLLWARRKFGDSPACRFWCKMYIFSTSWGNAQLATCKVSGK